MVVGAATLWGTSGTAQALGPDGITPLTVAFVRMVGGSLLLLYALRQGTTSPIRTLPRVPLLVAIAAMAGSQPLFFSGVARTGVAIGTVVTIGSGPLLAGAVGWLVRRESVSRRWYPATGLALIGTVLMASGGESAGVDVAGLFFALGAGLAWALYLVGAKAVFEAADPVFAAAVVFAGAGIALAPATVLSDATWVATGRGLLVVVWLALVATALSYILFSRGLERTPVAATATMSLAEPLTATVLGLLVVGEPVRATTLLGIALVVSGLVALARE